MVFLADLTNRELLFTYGIFGVQHGVAITEATKSMIAHLYSLLSSSAGRVDRLKVETHGTAPNTLQTTTFIAYWLCSEDYQKWLQTPNVKAFWDRLPDDAGVWREVMTVPKSRYMFAASQDVQWGLASLIDGLRQSNDEGYWGVYRHRLSDTPDNHTDPSDTFTSDYITETKAASMNGERKGQRVIKIPEREVSSSSPAIRKGRVHITDVPNNLCFVREGQRQSNVSKDELDLWLAKISPHARSWIDHLDTQRRKNGVLSFTTHLATEACVTSDEESSTATTPDALPETDQLAYFLDLAHFELAGRAHKGHVQLRKTVMEIYGPGGQMSQLGKAELFVELCVLKSEDLHAEYIGCTEGTGLMFLADI